MKGFSVFLYSLILLASLTACKKRSSSVNDLFKFPATTKLVLVRVNIDFTADANSNSGLSFAGQNLLLNAFSLDSGDMQVKGAYPGGTPVDDLPVTLQGPETSFDALLEIPVSVESGPQGYAFRFVLKPTLALKLADTETDLAALRGSIQANTDASVNNVDISIASNLAFRFMKNSVTTLNTSAALSSYAELKDLFTERQKTVEAGLNSGNASQLDSYIAAMTSGISFYILTDLDFQKSLAEKLLLAVDASSSASEKLAQGFTSTLFTLNSELKDALGDPASAISKVFTSNFFDSTSLPEAEHFANAVFAPLAIDFTDTDATVKLGGDITLTPPLVQSGVASYNVYFGGESKETSKILLIGNILASKNPLSVTLASGTDQPTDATRFWAYPVASGTELSIPASLPIANTGGTSAAPSPPANLTAFNASNTNTLVFSSVSGADSYNLYWSTSTPVRATSNRIRNVTSGYQHKSLLSSVTYYYKVSSVKNGIESALSAEAQAETAAAAPVTLAIKSRLEKNTLSWNATAGATSYNLYRSTSSPVTTSGSTKIANATSPYADSGLSEATTYYYAVSAVSQSGEERLSNTVSATTHTNVAWTGGFQASATVTGAWSSSTANQFFRSIDGGMNNPRGAAIDTEHGYIYVADSGNHRVQRFDVLTGTAAGSIGKTSATSGTCPSSGVASGWCTGGTFTNGSGDGQFDDPRGVAVDPKTDRLYITDYNNSRVTLVKASTGEYLGSIGKVSAAGSGTCTVGVASTWCTGGTFTSGFVDGSFESAWGIAIDTTQKLIYITRNYSVAKHNATTGAFIAAIGYTSIASTGTCPSTGPASGWCTGGGFSGNTDDGGFMGMAGVAIEPESARLFVIDNGNSAVSLVNLTTGAFIGRVGKTSGSTGTCPSSGIASAWCTGGTFTSGSVDGAFLGLNGIGVDAVEGHIYVTHANSAVVRLNLTTGAFIGAQGTTSASSGTCPASGVTTSFCTGGTFPGSLGLKGFPNPSAALVGDDGYLYVLSLVTSSITRLGI